MSASQTASGRSAAKFRSSRFGATGRSWRLSVVRGARRPATPPAGRQPHRAHQPFDAPSRVPPALSAQLGADPSRAIDPSAVREEPADMAAPLGLRLDRKSTRLNSSHANISYAVFCLKTKTITVSAFLLH